ncbi:MAG: hypothetical protein IJN50_02505 [Clostridia bacterium]|nr:hypothetical protein [Clostridia bacterium]
MKIYKLREHIDEYKKERSFINFGIVGLFFILIFKLNESGWGCFKKPEFLMFGGLFLACLVIVGIYKLLEIKAIAEIKELQEKFYQELPTDTYRKVEITFSSKLNDAVLSSLSISMNFYAKRKTLWNDRIAVIIEDSKGRIILDSEFPKKDVQIDEVYIQEWLPSEVTDEEEQPETIE